MKTNISRIDLVDYKDISFSLDEEETNNNNSDEDGVSSNIIEEIY